MDFVVYADIAYYREVFCGTAIAEDDFDRLAARASERVDFFTNDQAERYFKEVSKDPIAKATCAIAEILQQLEADNALIGGTARSDSVLTEITGQYHITYAAPINTATDEGQSAIDKAIMRAATQYLMRTGLLYRGVGVC